jgi:hypothetical protein
MLFHTLGLETFSNRFGEEGCILLRGITPCSLMQSHRAKRADVLKDQTISRRARVQARGSTVSSDDTASILHSRRKEKKEKRGKGKGGKKKPPIGQRVLT